MYKTLIINNKSKQSMFSYLNMFLSGADPGFSDGGEGGCPTLSNCYCCLTSPFSQEKVWYCVSL